MVSSSPSKGDTIVDNETQMATLSVQEAMGSKVDREAVATLVLPQLWAMSMGPCKLLWYPAWAITEQPRSAQRRAIPALHGSHPQAR